MEKFGVLTEDPEKNAANDAEARCPQCRSALDVRGDSNAVRCPKCGTKPFERP